MKEHHWYQRHRRQILPPARLVLLKTGGKFATGINDAGGKFAAVINDTGGKFANGVVDTGGNLELGISPRIFEKI